MNLPKNITVKELATILSEEFDRDNWGDIDPYLFEVASRKDPGAEDLGDMDDMDAEDYADMLAVLKRVCDRLNSR